MNTPSSEHIFSHAQNNILRWALKAYQMSAETATRGGYLSWATVASEIVCSDSYDRIVAELRGAENSGALPAKATSKRLAPLDDADRWPITGKKLERFVDGEKSRSTGERTCSNPEAWVRRVIYGFLHENGRLPKYFHEKGLNILSPAFALLDYLYPGSEPGSSSTVMTRDWEGSFRAKVKTEGDLCHRRFRLEKISHQHLYEVEAWSLSATSSAPKDLEMSGWAIVPPSDGLLIFLKEKAVQKFTTNVLFLAHSVSVRNGKVSQLRLGLYEFQMPSRAGFEQAIGKTRSESVFFLNALPVSFDRLPSSMKEFKIGRMRGEPALNLSYNDREDANEEGMSEKTTDMEFLYAVCEGNLRKVNQLIDAVEDINIRVAGTGGSALHMIAKYQLKDIFKVLRQRTDLDYLARDHEGRLPSQLAMSSEENVGLGALLIKLERQQAIKQGVEYGVHTLDLP